MIILDTNVISALMVRERDPTVVAWLDRQPRRSVWTTAITVYEVRSGLEAMPEGRRRQVLELAFAHLLATMLADRALPFDIAAAEVAGKLSAAGRGRGRPMEYRDTQIAGIVLARGATLATRNVRHFEGLDLRVVNPWDAV